jgi:chitin synthase
MFGWFLSWKLGNFKEGASYAARMKREAEIENWTANMQAAAPLTKSRIQSTFYGNNNKRKSLFPLTSRFTLCMVQLALIMKKVSLALQSGELQIGKPF